MVGFILASSIFSRVFFFFPSKRVPLPGKSKKKKKTHLFFKFLQSLGNLSRTDVEILLFAENM